MNIPLIHGAIRNEEWKRGRERERKGRERKGYWEGKDSNLSSLFFFTVLSFSGFSSLSLEEEMAQIETLGIIQDVESLVSDQLQVVRISLSLSLTISLCLFPPDFVMPRESKSLDFFDCAVLGHFLWSPFPCRLKLFGIGSLSNHKWITL